MREARRETAKQLMNDTMDGRLAADLEILATLFKDGGWKELRVESQGVSLLISTDRTAPALGREREVAPSVAPLAVAAPSTAPVVDTAATPATVAVQQGDVAIDPSWTAVTAPNLGTFYRSPKPGAANFVEVGQRVDPRTEICLIEVMKLFTSVQAGVTGTVRHIAVADAELVQGGQALIYIERG